MSPDVNGSVIFALDWYMTRGLLHVRGGIETEMENLWGDKNTLISRNAKTSWTPYRAKTDQTTNGDAGGNSRCWSWQSWTRLLHVWLLNFHFPLPLLDKLVATVEVTREQLCAVKRVDVR